MDNLDYLFFQMIFTFVLLAQILYNSIIRVWDNWITLLVLGGSGVMLISGRCALLTIHLAYYSMSYYIRLLQSRLVHTPNDLVGQVGRTDSFIKIKQSLINSKSTVLRLITKIVQSPKLYFNLKIASHV